ncbi:hypothetical protein [Segeticoccus rhizosphaerae]|jgi:hypothetical protein|uniref:hypothetical protein n=1 Tax=Segeticoccus rhizosphaerae TaxID=1104777 RepID=UPI00192E337A|nr:MULTISPECIES: hypothetical protein [Intrasporangiaceae]
MTLLTDHDTVTLVRLLKMAYPHEAFPDGPYERTAQAVLAAVAGAPRQLAQLIQGLHDLDELREVPFAELDDDTALTVLRGIHEAAFFKNVRGVAVVALYDDHEVWDLLGYEGPSFDKGGYVDRGFNDLDWLPEPKISIEEASA